MNQLTPPDLNFVLSRCPKDIVNLLKNNPLKLFLAGGFIRSAIAGEKVSDIDLFGDTADNVLKIAKDLAFSRKGRYFQTRNAITVLASPRFPVQFITRWLFTDPVRLVESFDFTVCQAVIWSDGVKFHSCISDLFYSDLAARRINYTSPNRIEDVGGSMLRCIKFVKRGYTVQSPSIAGMIARITISLNGAEKMDEARMKFVITGLLREVDPLTVVDGVDFVDEHEIIEQENMKG